MKQGTHCSSWTHALELPWSTGRTAGSDVAVAVEGGIGVYGGGALVGVEAGSDVAGGAYTAPLGACGGGYAMAAVAGGGSTDGLSQAVGTF